MRILLSIAGLLVVMAIIGFTVKQQLQDLAPPASSATAAPTGAADFASVPIGTAQQRVQQVQDDMQRALEQGAARASDADR